MICDLLTKSKKPFTMFDAQNYLKYHENFLMKYLLRAPKLSSTHCHVPVLGRNHTFDPKLKFQVEYKQT